MNARSEPGSGAPGRQLGVLLACFADPEGAAKLRRPFAEQLTEGGDAILDTVVLKVSKNHKATVHDPRRVLMGTLTPALTWGLFGLLTSGWLGLVIDGLLGALCGWAYTYYFVHHATKAQLTHVGKQLPPASSALLAFAQTSDPRRTLHATAGHTPAVASIAAITADLTARVFVGADGPDEVRHGTVQRVAPADETALASMIVIRYADLGGARHAVSRLAAGKTKAADVELVIETDDGGKRHVRDPKLGVAAMVPSDIVGWGAFGVLAGAIGGASGGGIFKGAVITGIAWGVFGAFAGALYGLWAGRSISARRLKGIGPLLARGTSVLVAWTDGAASQETIDTLTGQDARSQRLVLRFNPVGRGAAIEVAGDGKAGANNSASEVRT